MVCFPVLPGGNLDVQGVHGRKVVSKKIFMAKSKEQKTLYLKYKDSVDFICEYRGIEGNTGYLDLSPDLRIRKSIRNAPMLVCSRDCDNHIVY